MFKATDVFGCDSWWGLAAELYLLVLEVCRELIAVRKRLAAFALLLLLLAERQAGRLMSAALSPGEACWAGGRDGRAALQMERTRPELIRMDLKDDETDSVFELLNKHLLYLLLLITNQTSGSKA